jgi:hypothetical protein
MLASFAWRSLAGPSAQASLAHPRAAGPDAASKNKRL